MGNLWSCWGRSFFFLGILVFCLVGVKPVSALPALMLSFPPVVATGKAHVQATSLAPSLPREGKDTSPVVVSAPNGAQAFAVNGTISSLSLAQIAPLPPLPGKLATDVPVTAEYELRVASTTGQAVIVSLPYDASRIGTAPGGLFVPEAFNPQNKTWRRLPRRADAADGKVFFAVEPDPEIALRFRARYAFLSVERTFESTNFVIHYTPVERRNENSVFSDEEWLEQLDNRPTGNATRPGVPDFIEDLAVACERLYCRLLELERAGGRVFRPLSLPQHVYVRDCGEGPGQSPLGGPLQISNRRIENRAGGVMNGWEDLCHVLAHEMTHVFQGQYYAGGRTGNLWNFADPRNVWFIEAVATHFATLACQSSTVVKREFYTKDAYSEFLWRSLNFYSVQSYYMAGTFLEHLAGTYGRNVAGDALRTRGELDILNLDAEIRASGENTGIRGAFFGFAATVMTVPEQTGGLYALLKDSVIARTSEYLRLRGMNDFFRPNCAYILLERVMEPLSTALVRFAAKTTQDSLLCIHMGTANDGDLMRTLSYDFVASSSEAYKKGRSLEVEQKDLGGERLVVLHFGTGKAKTEFEQMIINGSNISPLKVAIEYYLLHPPMIFKVFDGMVTWSTVDVWNMPVSLMAGYNVYGAGKKLNEKPVPYGKGQLSFSHESLKAGAEVAVTVSDRYGNEWPEVANLGPLNPVVSPGKTIQLEAVFSRPVKQKPIVPVWKTIGSGEVTQDGLYKAPQRPGEFQVEVANGNNPEQKTRLTIKVEEGWMVEWNVPGAWSIGALDMKTRGVTSQRLPTRGSLAFSDKNPAGMKIGKNVSINAGCQGKCFIEIHLGVPGRESLAAFEKGIVGNSPGIGRALVFSEGTIQGFPAFIARGKEMTSMNGQEVYQVQLDKNTVVWINKHPMNLGRGATDSEKRTAVIAGVQEFRSILDSLRFISPSDSSALKPSGK